MPHQNEQYEVIIIGAGHNGLVMARYERGSILLTSNTSFAEWGNLLGDEILATTLLDRLLHHAEVLAINGHSYRMKERLPPGTSFSQPGGVRQEI